MQYKGRACDSALGSGLRFGLLLWRRVATRCEIATRGRQAGRSFAAALLLLSAALLSTPLLAQEAQIRKNLPARLPGFPAIDRVIKTPIPGLYEVNVPQNPKTPDLLLIHLFDG